jgi:hypothetical protein
MRTGLISGVWGCSDYMAESDSKPPEKKLSPWKQFLEDVSWDILFFRAFGNLLLGIFFEEGKAVKSGWFAFVVFTVIAFWGGCYYSARNIDAKFSAATNYFGSELAKKENEISALKGRLADSKTDLNEANRQKDVALQRLDYFESNPEKLTEIYSNIFARTPTNFQQVDSMFAQFNGAISNLTQIETEAKELQNNAKVSGYTSNQLADLGIEKLPDGRTKIGSMITGKASVVIDAATEGFQSYTNKDFNNALVFFQKAINAMETTHISGVVMTTGGDLTPEGQSQLYGIAAECAMQIHSNSLANEFAQKSVSASPRIGNKFLLTCTIANLALEKVQNNDIVGSFELFQRAITNYEAIENFDLITNSGVRSDVIKLYRQAASAADFAGKTNEAIIWRDKSIKIMK